MRNIHKIMVLSILIAFGLLAVVSLNATQPYWSMEPSTQSIERADSLTGFDVQKYVINLEINEQTHFISGSVEATVLAENTLNSLDYRLTGGTLAVSQVQVNGIATAFSHQDGIVHIPLFFTPGTVFTTKVFYSGIPANSPAPYNIGILFTASAVYTLSNPDAGRYWWCSYDHPWDKALVDWHITVRSDWLAAANGIRTGITDNGNGTRTHHWVCASPVATYVIGFAAGPYVEYLQPYSIPLQNFVLPGQVNNATIDFANVPAMIDYFSTVFGAYPFVKYGHMVVPMATYAAMEHQTMTTFGAAYLTGNRQYESIVAHELAHQWYGNYVTPLTMREVWLKESFATYSEFLWKAHHEGWQAGCNYMLGEIQQYYINWENSNGPHTIFNPEYNLMFAPPTYEKSASVLHMLRLKMGNDAFFPFIRALLTTYPNGNLVTSEFISLAQQYSGQNLTQFFEQWIFSPGIPNAKIWVFKSDNNQAKIYAQSSSPTTTPFTLELPLAFPGSALPDSVVVVATPEISLNYFSVAASDDLSQVQIDPHNWVLTRQKEHARMQLQSCLPYNSAIALSWSALSANLPVVGYKVYRKQEPEGVFSCVTPTAVTALVWTDLSVQNGITYQYYVCAVDNEGYLSLPSNILSGMPLAFPFDSGFLVVDETRDGNGAAISPSDQTVDDFYAYALQGLDFTQWDVASLGLPSLANLSHYPLVLWHCDDFTEMLLQDNLDLIGSYVLSGGKLLISGWKYPSVFSPGFMVQFLPGIELSYHNAAILISLQSDVYPVLTPDPLKLAAVWNNMLPMSYTFLGAQNSLYQAELQGVADAEPAAIKIEQGGSMVLLGFPLYFMQNAGVRSFLQQVLPQLYPNVANAEQNLVPAPLNLVCYPNPFSADSGIKLILQGGQAKQLKLYNLKGQQVYAGEDFSCERKGSDTLYQLSSPLTARLASGCYLVKIVTDRGSITRKLVFVK